MTPPEQDNMERLGIILLVVLVVVLAIIVFVITPSPKPNLKKQQSDINVGDTVLLEDCGGLAEANVISIDGKDAWVKGDVTSGRCWSLPTKKEQIIKVDVNKLKKLGEKNDN